MKHKSLALAAFALAAAFSAPARARVEIQCWHATGGAPTGAEGWRFNIKMFEMLGAERLVYGSIGDALFTLRIDGTRMSPHVDDVLTLHMEAQHLHWFAATQQRVRSG